MLQKIQASLWRFFKAVIFYTLLPLTFGLKPAIETINTDKIFSEPLHEKQVDRMIDEKLMKKKLSSLEEPYRQIIIHRYLDDLSIKEISAITGKSENNISVMIHRAIKILKNKIYHE